MLVFALSRRPLTAERFDLFAVSLMQSFGCHPLFFIVRLASLGLSVSQGDIQMTAYLDTIEVVPSATPTLVIMDAG